MRAGGQSAQQVVERDLDYVCSSLADEFEQLEGGRLLVTGGAGFLGYYLVQAPLHWNRQADPARRIAVTVYDHFGRGLPDWLEHLGATPELSLVQHDVTRPLPKDIPDFDAIVHAASIASPIYYRKHPIATMDANATGVRALLDYARERAEAGKPIRGILFFSTSEIYGDPDPANIPTPETYRGSVSCTGPRACYDESKRYGETLCVNFAREHGIPVAMARPFNNYGPGLKITDRRVIPDFARDVLADRDIRMLSSGAPTRTFCYVADAVVGYFKILAEGRPGEPYNIGVEAPEVSMAEVAERVAALARELFGYRGRVIREASEDPDYLVDNPNRRCPVIRKAREELGYDPKISLDEGLRRSLLWYREHREAAEA
jgi:nucleoside-diphosphate-sugar epimerase